VFNTRVLAIVAVACAAVVSSALAAGSTPPGKNGRIAFKRYLDGSRSTGAIYVIGVNGTAAHQVTKPAPGVVDDQPDWSPDGSLLAFYRCVPDGPCNVYTVKPDGSDLAVLNPADGQDPTFLPGGNQIVYTRSTGPVRHFANTDQIEHSDIVVTDLDGTNTRVLTGSRPFGGDYLDAQFSPDGTRFFYIRANSPLSKPTGAHALFVARADGSAQRQITPWSLDAIDPEWSPDGKQILFRSYDGGAAQSQIYVVRPDGSGRRPLTHAKSGTTVLSSSYSPDGKWITFSQSGRAGQPDIFVMRANGTAIRPVTRTTAWDSAPDWGPAG
jgi:Tol biopolymer transport system component